MKEEFLWRFWQTLVLGGHSPAYWASPIDVNASERVKHLKNTSSAACSVEGVVDGHEQ